MSSKYGTNERVGQPLRLFGTIKEIHEHYLRCSKLKEESLFFFDSTHPISIYRRTPAKKHGEGMYWFRVQYEWHRDVLLTNEKLETLSQPSDLDWADGVAQAAGYVKK